MKFAENCRAGGKWAYDEYLEKKISNMTFSIWFITA